MYPATAPWPKLMTPDPLNATTIPVPNMAYRAPAPMPAINATSRADIDSPDSLFTSSMQT